MAFLLHTAIMRRFLYMNSDLQKKFQQILSNIDPETIQKGLKTISDMMNTEEGQQLATKLKKLDKNKLMEQLNQIDEKQIAEKLENMDVNQITDKMNNLDKEQLIKELTNNPDLIKKINDFLDNSD